MPYYVSDLLEYNFMQIKILILYMDTTFFCNLFYTKNIDVNNNKNNNVLKCMKPLNILYNACYIIINLKIVVISLNNNINDRL